MIKALGKSDYFLIIEVIKKVIGFAALFITMWISVEAMVYSLIVTSILAQIINSWPNKKLLNYSYFEQIKDILPQSCHSLLIGFIVYFVIFLNLSDILTLIIQIPLGALVYIGLSKLFKVDSYEYCIKTIKELISKKKEIEKENE